MIAGQIGLRRLYAVYETDSYQKIEMPVNGQRRNLALLAGLQLCDQLIGRNGPFAGQQFCVRAQPGRCQSLFGCGAPLFGEFAPFGGERGCLQTRSGDFRNR